MAKPIRVTIKGAGEPGENAPTVADLLGQVRDFVEVLEGVERAVSDDHSSQIVWRVTDATRQNPITFELTPFATNPAIFVGARAEAVERATLEGLAAVRRGNMRPPHFTDETLAKVRKLHSRVRNGLAGTVVEIDEVDVEPLVIDLDAAREVEHMFIAARPEVIPYRSLGSVEGFVALAERDGMRRAVLRFRSRLDGSEVKAIVTGKAFKQVEEMRLSEVWKGIRIRVHGTIHHKSLGVIDHIDADYIEVMDQRLLPSFDDIVDPNFTGGLTTEDYLAGIRHE
jgi:hypothetical protein